ncbi:MULTISPECIES: hypothetical protein [Actinoalloteichus]|uniref:Uncharacterized protein n=1 Tax=Actinoalloteichus fjordicus TaxID=1612552 RepID=A0AAC9LBE1_9PSEU|nr:MULTISPECIES: hypothetical protein [Actinoalloteichus]APU13330.1 hypothetical protein UA74_06285 [Actinoalloteichus fjordicus]APU19280.1 hypothetical protein UA75_06285 [Actinoalloteichus sp. GBA129-24]
MHEQSEWDLSFFPPPVDFDELRTESDFAVVTVSGAEIVECERSMTDGIVSAISLRLSLPDQEILVQSCADDRSESDIGAVAASFLSGPGRARVRPSRTAVEERSHASPRVNGKPKKATLLHSRAATCLTFHHSGLFVIVAAARSTPVPVQDLPFTVATGQAPGIDLSIG